MYSTAWCNTVPGLLASIPAPLLKRGPGNHCLRVGGKFVIFVFYQLTFCTMVTHVVDYYQEREIAITTRTRITDLTEMHQTSVWKQVDLPVAESRSVLAHHSA